MNQFSKEEKIHNDCPNYVDFHSPKCFCPMDKKMPESEIEDEDLNIIDQNNIFKKENLSLPGESKIKKGP